MTEVVEIRCGLPDPAEITAYANASIAALTAQVAAGTIAEPEATVAIAKHLMAISSAKTLPPPVVRRAETAAEVKQATLDLEQAKTQQLCVRRGERDALLTASDYTQLPDAVLPKKAGGLPSTVAEWAAYRQQLRDYMASVTDPFAPPPFPKPPA